MGVTTNIAWCHHTFNGWRGCTKVSPGCKHCYAEALSRRNPAIFGEWGPGGTRVVASEAMWRQPLAWDRAAKRDGVRRRVFYGSLSDWLEDWDRMIVDANGFALATRYGTWPWEPLERNPESVSFRRLTMDDVRVRLLTLIAQTPNLDWLLLTKRPDHWSDAIEAVHQYGTFGSEAERIARRWLDGVPPENVWVGASVEDQRMTNDRIHHLLLIPAKVRFLSVEPILGPVDLEQVDRRTGYGSAWTDSLRGRLYSVSPGSTNQQPFRDVPKIDWVIVGGESGPNHRPCQVKWITDVVEQCRRACVPVFVKQDSGPRPECQGRIPDWAWACKEVPDVRRMG